MVGFAPGLATITARPPTPPKESTTKLSNDHLTDLTLNALNRPLIDTPEESPASSADYFKISSEKLQKKVGFSPWTEYHRPLSTSGKDSDSEGQIRRLPPSKDCKSLTKSILKNCANNVFVDSSNDLLAFDQSSLPAMLRPTTIHLASASRTSRLDAYSTLLACLSAYDDIPETQELSEKVVEVTGYIRRDVTSKITEHGTLDIQLATQALKVLTIFVYTPSMAKLLPEDFCAFILERSISSIEDASSPKILVSHYMHLIEKQKLGSKQMTAERVNRLLTALDGTTNRIRGNRVVGHRLMIYVRLLSQAKPVMVARVGNWIDHLVTGMLSTIKDIRARAITFGMDAGLHLGTTSAVTQACLEIFNRASPEGKKVVDFLSSRLIEMSKSKEDGVHVPQIWSIVILLLRSRRRQLECWEHIKTWLGVIQKCFNSNDSQTKFQANIAWNRFIFAINLDNSTCDSMVKMLRQPIVSSLERKDSDKNSKQAKQIARSSYCILLYYAFRPTATHAQLDKYWDLYVAQIISSCFTTSKSDVNYACEVLTALFAGNGKPKVWDEHRANVNGAVKPGELPCLDPKWVRSRTANVLPIFYKMFDLADWSTRECQEGVIMLAWRSFMTAIGNAGSKEVKVSMESMNAIAHIINGAKRLLEQGASGQRNHQQRGASDAAEGLDLFGKLQFLINEAVAKIGNIAFMERRVILTSQNSFEAADTPSSRSSREPGSLNSPTTHLLSLLLTHVQDTQNLDSYAGVVKTVMNIPLQSATSRRTQLAALRDLARLLSVDSTFNQRACLIFWRLLAKAASLAMKLPPQTDPHNGSPQYPGHDYREAVKILELGVQQNLMDVAVWQDLHRVLVDALREEIGNEAIIMVITEPLTCTIYNEVRTGDEHFLNLAVSLAVSLIDTVHWPQSSHFMERAQKLLWGVVHASNKRSSMNPYNNLYYMADTLLGKTYRSLEMLSATNVAHFFSAITRMLESCPIALQGDLISRTQSGLAAWIEDDHGRLSVAPSSNRKGVSSEVKKLSTRVIQAVEKLPTFSTSTLHKYQNLTLSGLKSRHKSIVNDFILLWNRTFGSAESLEYPKELQSTLSKLKRVTELQLPAFPETEGDEVTSSPFNFVDSQEDDDETPRHLLAALQRPTPMKAPSPLINQPAKSLALSRSPNTSTAGKSPHSARRVVKTTPKARLRHNDSQTQFAAVESSPLEPEPIESQHLTDRQKEVKERQTREAAAMFPEIRSSPRSASRPAEYSLPKLVLKSNQDQKSKPSMNDENSPVFPPDVLMNDFLGSSPTPSSSKKGRNDQRSDDEPPSSPPIVPRQLTFDKPINQPSVNDDSGGALLAEGDNHATKMTDGTLPAGKHIPTNIDERDVIREVANMLNGTVEGSAPKASQVQVDDRILSDLDVFVDAPAEPIADQTLTQHNNGETSRVMNSFQNERSSHLSTEDDQVTAQLVSEMERASSQQADKPRDTSRPGSKTSRKRKSVFDHPPSAHKRAKRTTSLPSQHKVAATPKPGEVVADCVMIETRSIDGGHVRNSQQIKMERSPSPSFITATQFEEETATTRRRPGRPRRTSRASQLTQDTSSVRRSPRQVEIKVEQDVDGEGMPLEPCTTRKSSRLRDSFTGNPITSNDDAHQEVTAAMTETPNNAPGRTPKRSALGKRRQECRHEASQDHDSSLDTDPLAPIANEGNVDLAVERHQAASADNQQRGLIPQQQKDRKVLASRDANGAPCRIDISSETECEVPTAQAILQGFKDMLQNIKQVRLGPEEERAMVGLLFESVREVHEAGRRTMSM